jgi:hypothetical protein
VTLGGGGGGAGVVGGGEAGGGEAGGGSPGPGAGEAAGGGGSDGSAGSPDAGGSGSDDSGPDSEPAGAISSRAARVGDGSAGELDPLQAAAKTAARTTSVARMTNTPSTTHRHDQSQCRLPRAIGPRGTMRFRVGLF